MLETIGAWIVGNIVLLIYQQLIFIINNSALMR